MLIKNRCAKIQIMFLLFFPPSCAFVAPVTPMFLLKFLILILKCGKKRFSNFLAWEQPTDALMKTSLSLIYERELHSNKSDLIQRKIALVDIYA